MEDECFSAQMEEFDSNGGIFLTATFEQNTNFLFSELFYIRFSGKQKSTSLPTGVK